MNDQREHPSSSLPLKYVSQSVPVCLNLCNGCNGCLTSGGWRWWVFSTDLCQSDVTDVDTHIWDDLVRGGSA